MPKNKQADLLMAILEYVNDENPTVTDLVVSVAFEPIRQQLKRDLVRWTEFRERQKEFGKMGGRPSNKNPDTHENRKGSLLDQRVESLNATVNVNANVNVREKKVGFAAPSRDQVREFFKEKGYTQVSADKSFDYYDSANWKDSNGKQVKNWKQKMIAVWHKPENKIPEQKPDRYASLR